jgi:hypothetical protein
LETRRTNAVADTRAVSLSKYGILSRAAEVIEDSSSDWVGGFVYDTFDGSLVSTNESIMGASTPLSVVVVPNTGDPTFRFYYPFDVKTTIQVSTMGSTPALVLENASKALDVVLQKNIENEFWTGQLASQLTDPNVNRYLSKTGSDNLTPSSSATGVRVKHGLAILERALGDATIGSRGVIHATRDVASILDVHDEDGALVTKLGNYVIAGPGYTGSGPGNAAAASTKAWMYATGPVTVRVGDVHVTPEQVGQAVDTSKNSIKYYVDRPAAVTWCTTELFAVLIDLSLDLA